MTTQEMYELYLSGKTLKEVARMAGLNSYLAVYLAFKKAGLEHHGKRPNIECKKKALELYALYQEGLSLQGVADEYKMTRSGVSFLFKRFGLKCRPRHIDLEALRPHIMELYADYQSGMPMTSVDTKWGRYPGFCHVYFKLFQLPTRAFTPNPITVTNTAKVVEALDRGATYREAGELIGRPPQEAYRLYIKAKGKARGKK